MKMEIKNKYNKEQPKKQTHKKRTRTIKKTKDKTTFFVKQPIKIK